MLNLGAMLNYAGDAGNAGDAGDGITKNKVTSSDGSLTVNGTNKISRKPGQRKRPRAERTVPNKRKRVSFSLSSHVRCFRVLILVYYFIYVMFLCTYVHCVNFALILYVFLRFNGFGLSTVL